MNIIPRKLTSSGTETMKKSVILLALALGVASAAFADDQAVVIGPGNQPVKSERFGTCVQTKWSAANNPCAPAAEPKQVQAAPTPAPAPEPAPQPVTQLEREQLTIYFDFNKSVLTDNARIKLDAIADAVRRSPKVTRVNIVGYTDQIGTSAYNDKLSTARANAVKAYLDTKIHIDVNVLGLRGLGDKSPVVDCSKVKSRKKKIACMAKDRRVEIEFEFQK